MEVERHGGMSFHERGVLSEVLLEKDHFSEKQVFR